MKHALTIAGSDSGGGAGIQADLKTFSALGVYGMSAITAVTAQNTQTVSAVEPITSSMVAKQICAVFDDIQVDAIKIGMTVNEEITKAIANSLRSYPLPPVVLDPVMVSTSGRALLDPAAIKALKTELFSLVSLLTPNLPEASVLTGLTINTPEQMYDAARAIVEMGVHAVLIKGGHLDGDALDIFYNGHDFYSFKKTRIDSIHTHGTGCTLSSAIAANLAKGNTLPVAIGKAKEYITTAIANAFPIGHGHGPVHHFYQLYSGHIKDLD